MLIDTHCHIHESGYPLPVDEVLRRAYEAGVGKMICVGTSEKSSEEAVAFAAQHENIFSAIGVHPHEAKGGWDRITTLAGEARVTLTKHVSSRPHDLVDASLSAAELAGAQTSSPSKDASTRSSGFRDSVSLKAILASSLSSPSTITVRKHLQPELEATPGPEFEPGAKPFTHDNSGRGDQNEILPKLVAIGEIGLDYFYTHSPRDVQIQVLEAQIQLAIDNNLPVIFHVREAFDDFWPIFDNFHGIRGELHSFTDNQANLNQGLKRGLYVGVNGISTFTKDPAQQKLFATIPLERMLLETDAPFLTPVPMRGTVNEPAFVSYVAKHHATIRGITPEEVALATTANASTLFSI
jgi:TatD family hydrolase